MAYRRNKYWYRSRRDGNQVHTEYLGTGPIAEGQAALDRITAIQRELEWEERRAQRAEIAALDRQLDATQEALRLLVRAYLLAHGYHTHKGQWRRRRHDRR